MCQPAEGTNTSRVDRAAVPPSLAPGGTHSTAVAGGSTELTPFFHRLRGDSPITALRPTDRIATGPTTFREAGRRVHPAGVPMPDRHRINCTWSEVPPVPRIDRTTAPSRHLRPYPPGTLGRNRIARELPGQGALPRSPDIRLRRRTRPEADPLLVTMRIRDLGVAGGTACGRRAGERSIATQGCSGMPGRIRQSNGRIRMRMRFCLWLVTLVGEEGPWCVRRPGVADPGLDAFGRNGWELNL